MIGMDGMDMHASLHNLTQMDKVRQDQHQLPVAHQAQNAENEKNEAAARIDRPNEAEEAEGKIIDPKKRRDEERRRRRRQKKDELSRRQNHNKNRGQDRGRFVDFSV